MARSGRELITRVAPWRPREPITAARLNETVIAVNHFVSGMPVSSAEVQGMSINGEYGEGEIWDEVSRTTETVRVTNPLDSSQYVDVERIKIVIFARQVDGSIMSLRFNN